LLMTFFSVSVTQGVTMGNKKILQKFKI
jgi:hypothetical protein